MGRDPEVSMRSSFGSDRYNRAGEDDFVCYSAPGDDPSGRPPLIIAHPHASSALGMFADPTWVRLYQALSEHYIVSVSDCGGSVPWGNGQTTDAIGKIRTQLVSQWGASNTKVGLLGISMGGLAVFNYARQNPNSVAFVCGIVPALNLANIKANYPSNYGPEIDAAYGGNYTDATYGNSWSPWFYRASYPAASIRTAIWYTASDTICLPQFSLGMQTAQPDIELYSIEGSPLHQDSVPPAIEGDPQPADWCLERLLDTTF